MRNIEIDLADIISLWNGIEDFGIHEHEIAVFIPDDISIEEIDEYCRTYMPLSSGYIEEEDWASFKEKVAELLMKREFQKFKETRF